MRNDILGAGIVLVIIGVILYSVGNNMISQSPWYILSYDTYQNMLSTGRAIVMFGYIFLIVGVIVSIAGIATPVKEQQIKEIVREPKVSSEEETPIQKSKDDVKTLKYCFQCGNKVEGNPKFCYKCGSKLR